MSTISGPRTPKERELAAMALLVEELQPALQRRDRRRQASVIARLIALKAPMGGQWQALANLALGCGEITLARQAISLFVTAQGDTPLARYHQAAVLEQAGALSEALEIMLSLPPDAPDPASHAYSLGAAALFMGHTQQAREHLERATRLNPAHGSAWLSLSSTANLSQDAAMGDRIIDAARHMERAPAQQVAPFYHAVGKVHAERGEHAAAFSAFVCANRATRSFLPFNRRANRDNAANSLHGWDRAAVDRLAGEQSEPSARGIFVTGLPRTGTTLVEQVLASHSAVTDGAEIARLPLVAGEVGGNSLRAVEDYVARQGATQAAQLWAHLLAERFGPVGRVIDKSLDTSRFLGIAAALLPDAPLVWMTRDPLDNAWSCFRTYFPTSMQWSTDLEDIAFHFRQEEQLLARWQDILGERLLVVPLESLSAEPKTWIRRILAHCGLAEEPAVFTPHKTERTVRTASSAQIRRPINREGVGTAEPYRAQLAPFLRAYGGV